MDVSEAILSGFDSLPTVTATISGVDMEVIFNQSSHRDNKVLGGYEPDNEFTVYVKTSSLVNPRGLKGIEININDEPYRIVTVKYGNILTHLECRSVDAK